MKKRKLPYSICFFAKNISKAFIQNLLTTALISLSLCTAGQTTLLTVDFETAGSGYTVSPAESNANTSNPDYWIRTNGTSPVIYPNEAITNIQGSYYFIGEDLDYDATPYTVTCNAINVSSYTTLRITLLAAGAGSGFNKEGEEYFKIKYQYDGGGYTTLAQFIGNGSYYTEDANADGTVDGSNISTAMQEFTYNIPSAGDVLQIQFQMLNGGSEEFAFDNVRITGVYSSNVAPTVTTQAVGGISTTSATGNGNITALGTPNPTAHGFCWNTTGAPTTSNSKIDLGAASSTGTFTGTLSSLTPGTTYYVKAYATNTQGTSYGAQVSFTTTAIAPTVLTSNASSINDTYASLGGNITSNGGSAVTERGVVYSSTNTSPLIGGTGVTKDTNGTGTGSFSESITSLTPNITYYYKAYAINSIGTSYGSVKSVKTYAVPFTILNTIDFETAGSGYSLSNASKWSSESFAVRTDISGNPDGIVDNVYHTYNGFQGTYYFSARSIDTSPAEITSTDINITNYTDLKVRFLAACSHSDVSMDNAIDPEDYFKVYAKIGSGSYVLIGQYFGSAGTVDGFFRDDDLDGDGDSGELDSNFSEVSFDVSGSGSTLTIKLEMWVSAASELVAFDNIQLIGVVNQTPTVTTSDATSVTGNSVTLGGNVSNDGGATVSVTGVTYSSTNSDPEIGGSGVTNATIGSGTGDFSKSISSLPQGTLYHFKAYATNSVGTSYGVVKQFTTLSAPTTQATEVSFSNIASTQMDVGWTRGNGTNCVVFIKQASSGTASPVDNTTYSANTSYGSGTQIGTTGWYCIYNGSGTGVTVTGLSTGLPYQVHVCEYKYGTGYEIYLLSAALNNPNYETTNNTPVISIDNTTLAYTENASPGQIDAAATVSDSDGDADWNGGTLEVQITANSEGADEISISDTDGDGTAITISGTNLFSNATDIADLSVSEGTVSGGTKLTITFDADATNAIVQEVLQSIRYRSTTDDPGTSNRTVTVTVTDKKSANSSDTRTIAITELNDEPSLTATGLNPTFTEGGAAATLYSSANASTIEASQTITGFSMSVTNITNGSSEIINADGTSINLSNGNTGNTATNSLSYSVSISGSTATLTFSGGTIGTSNFHILINGLSYQNNSENPTTSSSRVATITSISDSGSNTGSNDNIAALSITSTVAVSAVNDAPTLTSFAGVVETTTQNTEIEITLAELKAQGNEADVDGTVDAFIVNAVSTGSLKIGASTGTAAAFNATTNKTIDTSNNAYWTPANNADGTLNAFTTTVKDNNSAESTGAVQATVQVNDVTNPSVSSITISGSPAITATSISFVVAFSESVVNVSTDDFSLTPTGTASGTIASVSASSGTSINVTVNTISGTGTLRLDLKASTNIADDSANTPPAAYTSGSIHSVDRDGPTLSSTSPADNATGVLLASNITLTFNENIAFGTGNIQIIDLDDGTGTITIDAASPGTQASISTTTLTLNPSSDLEENTNYSIQVAATAIDDSYGNSYAGISDNTTFNFTSADVTPPTLSSSVPSDNASNATLSGNIVLTFDDNMVAGTGNITIKKTSDESTFEQIAVGDAKITISGTQVTINPAGTLAKGTGYYIEIDATALDDDAGNSFAGINDKSILNFTTVDVVINEVVTDPQQDWSSTSYSGTPGGTPGSTDEWLELLIKSDGIDLTGWTIDLTDTSPVSGDLTNNTTSAFRYSGYIGSGTFNNTVSGDYLVLGNVRDDAINNSITISLKDPGGAVVDAVAIGSGAPTGNAGDVYDEAVQRFTNGIDTDSDSNDFTRGSASIGSANTGPSVELSVSSATISDESGTATIFATLSAASGQNVTVTIGANVSSTATGGGTDYSFNATTITITAGNTTGTATLSVAQDTKDENNETVIIDITNVTNGTEAGTQQQTVTIIDDDDPPTVSLSQSATTIAENAGTNTITATLSTQSEKDVTVTIAASGTATGGGTDYSLSSTTIIITAGNTTGTATITAVQDTKDETDETIVIDISGITNGTESGTQQVSSSITDDDDPPTVTLSQSASTIAENAGANTITATLSTQSGKDVTVTIAESGTATGGGTDYSLSSTTITISAGNTTGTATITAVQDTKDETDETIVIDISGVTNGTESGTQQVSSSITDDDDPPTVTLSQSATTIAENAGTNTITATLSTQSGKDVTVTIAASGTATGSGTDYSLSSTTITISAGNTTGTATITAVQDTKDETDETIVIDIAGVTNGTESGTQQVSSSITDDDAPPTISINDASTSEGNSGTKTIQFTISLSQASGKAISVKYATADNTATTADNDYNQITATVVNFAIGDVSKTIDVTINGDTNNEGTENFSVNLSEATNATILDGQGVGTISNDDNYIPVASAPTAPTVIEDATNISLADDIHVTDTDGENQTLTVTITGGTVTLGTSGITFGGNGNGSASFTAAGTLSNINTALDAAAFTPTANLSGNNVATISFTSNDGTDDSNTASVTFSITPVNDEPSLSATGNNPTYTEGASASDLYSSVNVSTFESGQSIVQLILSVTNVNDGSAEIIAIDGSDVALTNGNTVTTSTNSMNVTVTESLATATVTISKSGGISSSAMQTIVDGITYRNTSENPNTSNRVVTLTSIKDDGGTANGGDDTSSLSISSTVTVNKVNDAPTLTSFAGIIETTTQNTEVEITLAELMAQGNEADVDGTVDAFIVNAVSTGSLKIGASTGTAAAFNATTNKTIDASNNAYWTPATDVYGTQNAFTTTVLDNNSVESTGAVQTTVQVNDVTNPSVSSIIISGTPAVTATSITFVVAFSEPVVNVSTDDFSLTTTGTASGTIASVSASSGTSINVTVNTITGTGTLRLDLKASTNIADASANTPPTAYSSGSIHTVDRDNPTLSSTVPSDNATGISASANITLTFSENIAFGTGNILIIDLDDGTGTITIDAASPGSQASISTTTLILNPSSDLEENTNYSIQVAATAIDDSYGNSYAGISDNTTFNFTSADVTPPTLSSSVPSDNASNATLSGNIVLTFDDNMVAGTGNITIKKTSDDSTFEQIAIGDAKITISGTQVTINPSGTLAKGTGYYIEIDATALDDDAGNSFAGINSNSTLNFTTVDVVINEVVTDPQQDWSSNDFNGTIGAGSITSGTDEWIELLIKSNGIDLTGWTIELDDGSYSPGNLTNTGAFDVSNYIGSGSFTNTISGDYLVLGNVDGSGAMNNTITISLKDPGGAIVDAVAIGSGAPSGNANNIYDESVQRFSNGIDTNTDSNDFTRGPASIGTANTGPGVELSVSSTTIADESGTATITATLSAASGQNVTVTIAANVTSTATGGGTDYSLSATSITITAGNITGTATLTAAQDSKDEPDETVIIDITNVTNGTEAGTQQQTITIIDDDDPPTVSLTQSATTIAENAGTNTITATLSTQSGKDVTVTIAASGTATGGGTDYSLSSTTITIAAGNTTGTATITAVQDTKDETDETIVIDISGVTNGTESGTQQVSSSITDDDDPPTVTLSQSASTIAENAGTNTITATLSTQSGKDVTVTIAASGTATGEGADYSLSSTTITISAGNTTGTATITAVQDGKDETEETIIIDISGVTNGTENGTQQVSSSITDDDDPPTVTFTTVSQTSTDETGTMIITAQLSTISGKDVIVPFTVNGSSTATGGGTDYSITTSPITITAGNSSQTINISITTDVIDEYNETVIVDMGAPTNATQGATTSHTATITDDDIPPLVTLSVLPASISEALGTSIISATLSSASAKNITINLSYTGTATGGGTDYLVSGNTITINAGGTSGTITTTAVQDILAEGSETVIIDITGITNGTEDGTQQETITIIDDDLPGIISVSVPANGIYKENAILDFTVTFNQPVTINTSGGIPFIPITIGTSTVNAILNGNVSNTINASFRYSVLSGEEDTDGISIGSSINTNGGTIRNSTSLDAVTSLFGVGNTSNVKVDAIIPNAPVITGITSDSNTADDGITNDNSLRINGTSEANASIEIFINSVSIGTTNANSSGSWQFDNSSTSLTDGNYSITATASDAAGNTSVKCSSFGVTIDTAKPTIVITSNASNPTNQAFTATFTFSENVQNLAIGDIVVSNAALSNFTVTNASTYTATVTPATDGPVTLDVAAATANDLAGNANLAASQFTINYDQTKPTVLVSRTGIGAINNSFVANIIFNESVTGFTIDDVFVTNANTGNFNSTSSSVYSVEIFPINDGDITVKINSGIATDAAGNTNLESNTLNLKFDHTRPTVVISAINIDQKAKSFTAEFSFSEPVIGLSRNDIIISNGTIINFISIGSTYFKSDVINTTEASVTIDLPAGAAHDDANNLSIQAETFTVEFDYTAPTVLCKEIILDLDETGNATINPEDIDNGSSDASGLEKFEINKSEFTCANIGDNTVILTVTDFAGNSASCNAKVTVQDITTVRTKDITIILDDSGTASITPSQIDNGSFNACGIASYELDKTTFNCSNIGDNLVQLTITDNNGKTKTANATVNVTSVNRQPVFNEIADITVLEDSAPATVTIDGINHGDCDGIIQQVNSLTATSSNNFVEKINVVYSPGNATASLKLYFKENTFGETTITVTITDDGGITNGGTDNYSSDFKVTILPVNDAPIVNGTIDPQQVEVGTALNLSLPSGLFTDIDIDDVLTYSAKNRTGINLPEWLNFNPTNGSFSGTPSSTDIGNFLVQLTATDPSGLSASLYFEIIVYQTLSSSISGNLYEQSALLENGIIVCLYKVDNNSFTLITRTTSSSQGKFIFYNLSAGNYIVEACITDETLYKNLMTTYFEKSKTWADAKTIQLGTNENQHIEMVLLEKPVQYEGNHRIFGTVVKQKGNTEKSGTIEKSVKVESGEPVYGANIHLKLNDQLISTTISDENGQYKFMNLPYGNYKIEVMIPGFTQTEEIEVIIDESSSEEKSVNFTVWEGSNEITSIEQVNLPIQVKIYPNPTTGKCFIEIEDYTKKRIMISIYSMTGQTIFENNDLLDTKTNIDLTGQKPGIYLIKIKSETTEIQRKLILK